MGKSQGVVYGKVQVFSESESLDSMRKTLVELVKELGYPESGRMDIDGAKDDEMVALDEEIASKAIKEKEEVEAEEAAAPPARVVPLAPWVRKKKDG